MEGLERVETYFTASWSNAGVTIDSINGLTVNPAQSIVLLGGNVNLDGEVLKAPGGRVELGGVSGTGTVGLKIDGTNLALTFPTLISKADVSLSNNASLNVIAGGGGSISINAQKFLMDDNSNLRAGMALNNINKLGQAGNINIKADGGMVLDRASTIFNNLFSGVTGSGGNIIISSNSLSIKNFSEISNYNYGNGNIGDIIISTTDRINIDGIKSGVPPKFSTLPSGIYNVVLPGAKGNGGSISISSDSLSMTDGGQINTSTLGFGNSGKIAINTINNININGVGVNALKLPGTLFTDLLPSGVFGTVFFGAMGNGSNIIINTRSLNIINGGGIAVNTYGNGDAGSVAINTLDSTNIDGLGNNRFISGISSSVFASGIGKGGNISVTSRFLNLTNGGQINTSTTGNGDAGNVTIIATDGIKIDGFGNTGYSSAIGSGVSPTASGNGGNININSPSLSITNGGVLSTVTFNSYRGGNIIGNVNNLELKGGGEILSTAYGSGQAGNIDLNVKNGITVFGNNPVFFDLLNKFGRDIAGAFRGGVDTFNERSGILANTDINSKGDGGSININTGFLNIDSGGNIAVNSSGLGNAGTLQLNAESISLNNFGEITAATSLGTGGNVSLNARSLQLRHDSSISATAGSSGNGGNIGINANTIVALENSGIVANAYKGRGGNIQIATQGIFASPNSPITASSQLGVNGTVSIRNLGFDLKNNLVSLNNNFIATEQVVAGSCLARRNRERSSFVVTGTDGLPERPTDSLSSYYPILEVSGGASSNAVSPRPWKVGDPIVEAQEIVKLPDGRVILASAKSCN